MEMQSGLDGIELNTGSKVVNIAFGEKHGEPFVHVVGRGA
jgi:hypothetical protein